MVEPRITCVVADDHPAVLDAVTRVLEEAGVEVLAAASDGLEALDAVERLRPRVAVLDIRMRGLSGIEIARRLSASPLGRETAVCLYTSYGDRALVTEALDCGARGYLLKEAALDELARAVEQVAAGGVYVDGSLAGLLASGEAIDRLPALTQREREILHLLADGLRNEEIARRLFLSPHTVKDHVTKAMRKLSADTRTQAVATALRRSLIA